MSLAKRLNESRSWKRISTGLRALRNRLLYLQLWLPVRRGKRLIRRYLKGQISLESLMFWPRLFLWEIAKYTIATIVGIALFHYVGNSLFGFYLLDGLSEIRNLHGPARYWSSLAGVSMAIACWSVGGTALYFLNLLCKWGQLYGAGGK